MGFRASSASARQRRLLLGGSSSRSCGHQGGRHTGPQLYGVDGPHGKNLLKAPHGKKDGPETSCTICGLFPTFPKTFSKAEESNYKRRNVILLQVN